MSVATSTAIAIGAGVGAAGSLASGIMGSSAAESAANTQARTDYSVAELQAELAQEGLNLGTEEYNNTVGMAEPGLETGYGGLANLDYLLGIPTDNMEGFLPGPISTPGIPNIPNAPGYSPLSSLTELPPTGTPSSGGTFSPYINPTARNGEVLPVASRGTPTLTPASGTGSTGTNVPLSSLIAPGLQAGELSQGWTTPFTPPTIQQAEQYPGYEFQLEQGKQALDASAAAQGGLISGGEGKALEEFGQGLAQTDYQNVYNQALQQYQQAYNIFQNNQNNLFNRYAALAGTGQTTASQLNSATTAQGANIANILLGAGGQIGNAAEAGAGATASGYIGSSNALTGGISGATGGLSNMIALSSLLNAYGNRGGSGVPDQSPEFYSALGNA